MKYIHKDLKNEPQGLRDHRATTSKYTSNIVGLREHLVDYQGGICGYCMRRISMKTNPEAGYKPFAEIEHIKSQEENEQEETNYFNLVVVCNGNFGDKNHCDKTDKYQYDGLTYYGKMNGKTTLSKLIPTNRNCETIILIGSDGKIIVPNGDSEVEHDILKLNLNDEKLIQFRKNKIDAARKQLEIKEPTRRWQQKHFDELISVWSSKDKDNNYKDFCMAAIHFLQNLKKMPKYQ